MREYKIGAGSYGKVVSILLKVFYYLYLIFGNVTVILPLRECLGSLSKPCWWTTLCNKGNIFWHVFNPIDVCICNWILEALIVNMFLCHWVLLREFCLQNYYSFGYYVVGITHSHSSKSKNCCLRRNLCPFARWKSFYEIATTSYHYQLYSIQSMWTGLSQISFVEATSCTFRDCHDWCLSWGIWYFILTIILLIPYYILFCTL